MIEKAGQDLETNRQIIRQIRVDDRSKSVYESRVNIYHEASVTSYVYEIRPRAFRWMLTSADRILQVSTYVLCFQHIFTVVIILFATERHRNDNPEIFSRPQVTKNSRQYLLL